MMQDHRMTGGRDARYRAMAAAGRGRRADRQPESRGGQVAPARRLALHAPLERLLGEACVDHEFAGRLLADPVAVALARGLEPRDADLLSGIRAADLGDFARQFVARVYGQDA